jgi:hypothetical protein
MITKHTKVTTWAMLCVLVCYDGQQAVTLTVICPPPKDTHGVIIIVLGHDGGRWNPPSRQVVGRMRCRA